MLQILFKYQHLHIISYHFSEEESQNCISLLSASHMASASQKTIIPAYSVGF